MPTASIEATNKITDAIKTLQGTGRDLRPGRPADVQAVLMQAGLDGRSAKTVQRILRDCPASEPGETFANKIAMPGPLADRMNGSLPHEPARTPEPDANQEQAETLPALPPAFLDACRTLKTLRHQVGGWGNLQQLIEVLRD